MESTEKLAFAARAYIDYGSVYETDYLSLIKDTFPGTELITLPVLDELHESKNAMFGVALLIKEKIHFFPLIDKCDIFIYAPIYKETNADGSRRPSSAERGKLSEGVKDEVLYALSIGKPVYKLVGDKFKRILSISDDEELITQLVFLNKVYKVLGDFPEIHSLIKTEKRLNIHPKYVDFLFRNKKIRELIEGFLSSGDDHKDHVRPITTQYRYPSIKQIQYPVRYIPYNSRRKTLKAGTNNILLTFDNLQQDVFMRPDREGEIHFYECFFDKTVLDGKKLDMEIEQKMKELVADGEKESDFKAGMVLENHITGIGIVFDIDAPPGTNIFLKKWWPEFMALKDGVVAYAHDDLDLKCICSTTGKGLNVSCEPYWFDDRDDNFYDFKELIEEDIDELNTLYGSVLRKRSKGKGVQIDNSAISWSIYKKMFFGYSAKPYKITIPISKEEDDREWVKQISDVDYFFSNETENVDEIVRRSKIERDKWW